MIDPAGGRAWRWPIGAEAAGTPTLLQAGLILRRQYGGKEVRFGLALSALWAAVTTGLSCGAVNAMHGSFTPSAALFPGADQAGRDPAPAVSAPGLYGMLVMAIIAVFVPAHGGRTPEYLGKKIEPRK